MGVGTQAELETSCSVSSNGPRKLGSRTIMPSRVARATSATRIAEDGRDSISVNGTFINDLEVLESEKELLGRMLQQQHQLRELKERQRRVLLLQQELASMEASAEVSLEVKLDKLKTAKTRLDELEKIVSTIRSAGVVDDEAASPQVIFLPDRITHVRNALKDLNELKNLFGMKPYKSVSNGRPKNNLKVSLGQERYADKACEPTLPQVNLFQHGDDDDDGWNCRQFSQSFARKQWEDLGSGERLPFHHNETEKLKSKLPVVFKSAAKLVEEEKSSLDLLEEIKTQQHLLHQLKEHRQQLDELINMTNSDRPDSDSQGGFDDTIASAGSDSGSFKCSPKLSEEDDLSVSQSGRIYGVNDIDPRQLIDSMRNQKIVEKMTENPTATWGSSDTDDNLSLGVIKNQIDDTDAFEYNMPSFGISVKDAFTQANQNREHEIDFRPPTRRRRNLTQPDIQSKSIHPDNLSKEVDVKVIQDGMDVANLTMHILLEDQRALSKLLINTYNLKQTAVPNKLCYGISPDFLIYQLDNCSTQFAAILKDTEDLQWKLYNYAKGNTRLYNSKQNQCAKTPLSSLQCNASQDSTKFMVQNGDAVCPKPLNPSVKGNENQSGLLKIPLQKYVPSLVRKNVSSKLQNEGSQNEIFEALRDRIYSEAAVLISQNEPRPHFLVDMFHILQQLNTDYMRQHALYALHDLVNGYLSNVQESLEENGIKQKHSCKMNDRAPYSNSGGTLSRTSISSGDKMHTTKNSPTSVPRHGDHSLKASCMSESSTPNDKISPFRDLGSTAMHVDAALQHVREFGLKFGRLKQEIKNSDSAESFPPSHDETKVHQVYTKVLKNWIKKILAEITPILKTNHDKVLDDELVMKMCEMVTGCLSKNRMGIHCEQIYPDDDQSGGDKINVGNFLSGQIESLLDNCLSKFIGCGIGSCGEDIVVALSEVLLNDVVLLYMMRCLGGDIENSSKHFDDVKSSSLSSGKEIPTCLDPLFNDGRDRREAQKGGELQTSIVDSQGNKVVVQEPHSQNSPDAVIYDLSVSETKPLTSYGSGEDEEERSGDEYYFKEPEICTSVQQNSDLVAKERFPSDTEEPNGCHSSNKLDVRAELKIEE